MILLVTASEEGKVQSEQAIVHSILGG